MVDRQDVRPAKRIEVTMTDEQIQAVPLKAAYEFGKTHGLEREVTEIRGMDIEWDLPCTSSVRRGYIVELFGRQGLFDEFKKTYWLLGDTPGGVRK